MPDPILTLQDRCDRCPAQAFVRAQFADGTLDFCKHHYEQHQTAITEKAFNVIDERHVLDIINEKETGVHS